MHGRRPRRKRTRNRPLPPVPWARAPLPAPSTPDLLPCNANPKARRGRPVTAAVQVAALRARFRALDRDGDGWIQVRRRAACGVPPQIRRRRAESETIPAPGPGRRAGAECRFLLPPRMVDGSRQT